MILDEILDILKKENDSIAYIEKNISYTYNELYRFVSNIYNFLLLSNTAKRVLLYPN